MLVQHVKHRRRKVTNRPEQELQIAVMTVLDIALPKDAIAFHVPNGGSRSRIEAGILKAMGVKAGVCDILIVHQGRVFGIEMKAEKGSMTSSQREMIPRLRECGMRVEVARSIDEVVEQVRGFGIPIRVRDAQDAIVKMRLTA